MVPATVIILMLFFTVPAGAFSSTAAAAAAAAGGVVGAPQSNSSAEFIRRSCSATLYPSLCYNSLAGYASAVAEDPTQLAVVAANVSLSRVSSASFHVASLRRAAAAAAASHSANPRMDPRTASALSDCVETLGEALDLTRQAAKELALLPTAEGLEVAWRVSNAQTWMSAALTNEDTCTDGFASISTATATSSSAAPAPPPPPPSVKVDVCGRVRRVKQYTSNALALVNSLVERHER